MNPNTDTAHEPAGPSESAVSYDAFISYSRQDKAFASALELRLRGHRDRVRAASFSPDGRRVVTAGRDGTLRCGTRRLGRQRRQVNT
jgi:WD40 repeat protein